MRIWVIGGFFFFLLSCGSKPREAAVTSPATDTIVSSPTAGVENNTDLNFAKNETTAEPALVTETTKQPSGVYRFLLPYSEDEKILHTISFSPGTFRLQEEYGNRRDSIVVTEGTWAPSAGYIWLYKGQIVRGRYTWRGDTLHYYSPRMKKAFPMEKPERATANATWQKKRQEGAVFYAIGTEPFWSVTVTSEDSVVVNMPDWKAPLTARLWAKNADADSTVYTTASDSVQVTVYPLFCSDGMSDFLYTRRVKLIYKGETFSGCGEPLR